MVVVLSLSKFDPNQISRQYHAEESQQNRDQVNDCSSRFERVSIDLHARLAVAEESRKNKQHTRDDRNHAQPRSQSRRGRGLSLEVEKLLERDREAANGESENDRGDAGTNPC